MATSNYDEKLKKYVFEDSTVYVGFANFDDAKQYADETGGTLEEVAFKHGNDNPEMSSEAGLMQNHKHFAADAGPEYRFLHAADPEFRDYADQLQKFKSDAIEKNSPEEKFITNAEIEVSEDPIIVLKNGEFESVTSRERCKYLKGATVYEIAVERKATQSELETKPDHY